MKKKHLLYFAAMGALYVGSTGSVFGADIYGSRDTGSNSNPGTKQEPKKLLWKVMKAIKSGDVIRVAEGTYIG